MILVTGVTGFIGGHLLESLIKKYGKQNIVALTSAPISKCDFLLHNDYNFDINYFVNSGFENIEIIIHAGAFMPKSNADANYINGCNSNIISTTKLLSSILPKLKKFIFFSTVDVYAHENPITELTPISPASLYGHSKVYCEQIITTWALHNNICHQILRIGHVYGEGEEKFKKIIPVTMQRLLSNIPLQMNGDGIEIRSFIYVQDAVNAILNALKIKNEAGIINLVGHEKISMKDLLNEIIAVSRKSPKINLMKKTTPNRDLIFDNSKMRDLLYIPKVGLKEGLLKEWNYMKKLSK